MSDIFEKATEATEAMFNAPEQKDSENTNISENDTQASTEDNSTPQQNTTESQGAEQFSQAAETAEVAAIVASQKNAELEQAREQISLLQQQNEQLQGTINEISKANEQATVAEMLSPPVLNINELAFADENTIREAQEKYASEMTEYTKKQIMDELSPFLEQAKEGVRQKEQQETIDSLSKIPELSKIGDPDMRGHIEHIIKNNSILNSDNVPMQEKYITAYLIARGVNAINTPENPERELSVDELMGLYNSNSEFKSAIEKQRISELSKNQQVPPFSASSGAANAALNIKEKPKTFEEASERTRKMFGM